MHYLPRSSGIEELSSSQDRRGKKKLDQGSMVARLKGEEGSSLAHSDPVFSFFNMVFRNAGIRIGCLLLSSLVKAFLLDCIIPREDFFPLFLQRNSIQYLVEEFLTEMPQPPYSFCQFESANERQALNSTLGKKPTFSPYATRAAFRQPSYVHP
jgi:hypothetical protein